MVKFITWRLLTGLVLLAVCIGGSAYGKSERPGEMFWAKAPTKDDAVFVWNFDEHVIDDDALDEDLTIGEEDDQALATMAGTMPGFIVQGNGNVTEHGRFGGGFHLQPDAILKSDRLSLEKLLANDGTLTVDLWVCLNGLPDSGEQRFFILTSATDAPLQMGVTKTGHLRVTVGEQTLLTHRRSLRPDRWTHLALTLTAQAPSLSLSVDGHREATTPTTKTALEKVFAHIGDRLMLQSLKGELLVDAIRLGSRVHRFYPLQDDSFHDPDKTRPLVTQPPYFASLQGNTLRCGFDGNANLDAFVGTNAVDDSRPSDFVTGVRGQALNLSDIDAAGIMFAGMDIIPQAAGTIEFWFRPKNWDNAFVGDYRGSNVKHTRLFRLVSKQHSAPYMGHRRMDVRRGRSGRESELDVIPIHPGKWTHVLCTWQGAHTAVYLDGVKQRIPHVVWSGTGHPHERAAFADWQKRTGGKQDGTYRLLFNQSDTLIDELRVYPWAMQKQEIKNAYTRFFLDAKESLQALPAISTDFVYQAHNWQNAERLHVKVTCLPVGTEQPVKLDCELLDEQGRKLGQQHGLALNDTGKVDVLFDKALPFAAYTLRAISRDGAGKILAELKIPYKRSRPPWYQNQLGRERRVPVPWTELVRDDHLLTAWGREIELGDNGLPRRISALEQAVLAAPVSLNVQHQGKRLVWTPKALTFTETAADRMSWQATGSLGEIPTTISGWMAYDGLIYTTVTLAPSAATNIDRLEVQFPMQEAVCSQLICNGAGRNFRASSIVQMIPAGKGSVWNTRDLSFQQGLNPGNYCSQIWLGGDDVGLSFSGENDQGWTISDKHPAQEILRDGKQVIFQMNVIAEPTTIATSHSFHFIVQPTPTKPMNPSWRGWNRMPKDKPNGIYDAIDDFVGFSLKSHPKREDSLSFEMEPHSWEAAASQKQGIKEKFGTEAPVFLYMDYSWPRPGKHFKDWNHDLWAGTGRLAWTVPEVEDYMVWIVNEYIRRDLIDGIYVDDVSVGRTWSLAGTAYPWPGNEQGRRQGFSHMGYRRFCERIWKCFLAQGKEPHIVSHMTQCFEIPALSFNMSVVNGEARMIGLNSKGDTMNSWSRDELRIMGNGPKWGFATFWKPTVEVHGAIPKALEPRYYRQVRTMHAHVMQADMWYLWHFPSARYIMPALHRFGMDDPKMRFIPYWKSEGLLNIESAAAADLRVGMFVKQRKALVMISNFAHKEHELTLSVKMAELFGEGVSTAKWRDVDPSLQAPVDETEAPAEMDGTIGDDTEGTDELALDDPDTQAADNLAITANNKGVRLKVRKRDYRLLELTW